jgi:ADP-ribosylglycohydrolase
VPDDRASSREWLDWLLDTRRVRIERPPWLDAAPPPLPGAEGGGVAGPALRDRVEGMLLGLAIGDALGNPTESTTPRERAEVVRALTGDAEVRDYLPNRHADDRRVGLPSDDTQLALWTLEHLLAHGRLVPPALANAFLRGRVFGIGRATDDALARLRSGVPWYEAGSPSAGNGALMRVAPLLVPYLRRPEPDLWADTVLAAVVTHNDRASTAASLALIRLLWATLALPPPPADPSWWVDTFCDAMADVEGTGTHHTPRGGPLVGTYEGPLWGFAREQVRRSLGDGEAVRKAQARFYSGAYLLETVPCVLLVLARHARDPEEAIVRAVNDTRDNDTVAAIAGAVVGALHGAQALPRRWREGLLGRIVGDGPDGELFEVIGRALDTWLPGAGAAGAAGAGEAP